MAVNPKQVGLFFVEGDTEEEFYSRVFDKYLNHLSKKVENLHGHFKVYGKILDKTSLLQKSRPFLRHDYRFVLPMRICSTEDSHQNLA